jgi:hypothetical protein
VTTGIENLIEEQGKIGQGVLRWAGRGSLDEVIETKMVGSGCVGYEFLNGRGIDGGSEGKDRMQGPNERS